MPKPPAYSEEDLKKAIAAVREAKVPLRSAAKTYGVPRVTVSRHLIKPPAKRSFGPSPILTVDEEAELVSWIIEMGKRGFPRKMEDVQLSVKKFLDQNPRDNPFRDNLPGDGWANAFLKRHPTIVSRTSEGVTAASASVTETNIRGWFREVHDYLSEKNLLSVLDNPSRIFNADESGFSLCPETGKVLAEKGSKNVYSVETSSSKESITVLYCFSGSGEPCPPFIVYPYKRIPERVALSIPQEYGYDKSDEGWMTAEVFTNFIRYIFDPHLDKNNIERPVILFVDGHKSHLTLDLSELCSSLEIELIALYPNSTRILQPADVSVFRPFKCAWKKAVRAWRNEHEDQVVDKQTFAPVLKIAVEMFENPEILKNGFKAAGLFPFTPDSIDFSKCLGKDVSQNSSSSSDSDVTMHPRPEETASKVMQFDDFVALVGQNALNMLGTRENDSTPVKALARVRDFFGCANCDSEHHPEAGENIPRELQERAASSAAEELNSSEEGIVVQGRPTLGVVQGRVEDALVQLDHPEVQAIASTSSDQGIRTFLKVVPRQSRKGKRNIERLTYAVTSEQYRDALKRKVEEKENREKEKQERKERRLEKREEKLARNKAKENSNLCDSCKKYIRSNSNKLQCSNPRCMLSFHARCVPTSHKDHIPDEEEDRHLYVCHHCYQQDETDEEPDFDDSSSDDGSLNMMATEEIISAYNSSTQC